MTRLAVLLLLLLLVAGCGAAETETAAVTPAAVTATNPSPSTTAAPSATPSPGPTVVPTATPAPTVVPSPSPTPPPLRYLAIFGGRPAGGWDEANLAAFQALHPQLSVLREEANLYARPVPSAPWRQLAGDNSPDVISGYIVGEVGTLAETGRLADLSDLYAAQGWYDAYPPAVVNWVSVDGVPYFVPQMVQWHPIWYRADIFAELGLQPPRTWEELLGLCDALNAADVIPITVSSIGWLPPLARWFTMINLRLNGHAFHEALMDGQVAWTDARVVAVFDYWRQLIDRDCFGIRVAYDGAAEQLETGRAAMYNLGEWISESYADGLPPEIDFFRFPIIDPAVETGELIHMYGAYMTADSPRREAGEELLAYLGGAASQTTLVETLNRVAVHGDVDPALYNDVYRRGREELWAAERLTQLFEINTHPTVAEAGLEAFVAFFRAPERIEEILAELEEERLDVYGPLPVDE